MFLVFDFVFDNIGFTFIYYCVVHTHTHTHTHTHKHTPNIEVLCSNKGVDVEISTSNMLPRELYRIILSESNGKI